MKVCILRLIRISCLTMRYSYQGVALSNIRHFSRDDIAFNTHLYYILRKKVYLLVESTD